MDDPLTKSNRKYWNKRPKCWGREGGLAGWDNVPSLAGFRFWKLPLVSMTGTIGSQPGLSPALAPVPPIPQPPTQPLSLRDLSLQTSSHETRSWMQFGPKPQSSFARRLYPEMEPLVPSSRPSIHGSVARLDYLLQASKYMEYKKYGVKIAFLEVRMSKKILKKNKNDISYWYS